METTFIILPVVPRPPLKPNWHPPVTSGLSASCFNSGMAKLSNIFLMGPEILNALKFFNVYPNLIFFTKTNNLSEHKKKGIFPELYISSHIYFNSKTNFSLLYSFKILSGIVSHERALPFLMYCIAAKIS
jgi:hypothetical protein